MNFSIFDSGNLVASYQDEQAARDALAQLVADDPETADDVVLLSFDETACRRASRCWGPQRGRGSRSSPKFPL